MGPLSGIRVIEMAGLGPVPMCGMMLSDLGAEVFLVERASSASAESTLHVSKRDMMRRGKVPIALDLKAEAAIALVLALVENSDVLIEGFRPGVMERLGLGPEECLQRNKRLVYGRLTGWGQTGPLAQTAGHDPNYIALTGTLYHSGSADQPPQAPPTLLGDSAGGAAMLALGISSALIPAIKEGKGQVIDAAIVEGTAYLASFARSFYLAGQLGNNRGQQWMDGGAPWNRTYQCADGAFVTLCSVEEKFYQLMLELLGMHEEPLFAGRSQWEKQYWPEQCQRLQELFRTNGREHWSELLEGTDACFAPVLNYGEAPLHRHNQARQSYMEVDGEWHPKPAPRFSATECEPRWDADDQLSATNVLRDTGIDDRLVREAGLG